MSRPDKNIPKGYFDNLPQKMSDLISDLKDDVQSSAPHLYRISKEKSYKVPDGYFDQFFNSLNIDQSRTISLISRFRPLVAAASIIGLVTLIWVSGILKQDQDIEMLAMTDVYSYYYDNIDELDHDLIWEISEEEGSIEESLFEDLSQSELDLFEETIISNLTDQELLDIL